MPRRKSQKDPFEVRLSEAKQSELIEFLAREIEYAMTARASIVGDDGFIDDAQEKYKGGDGSLTKDTPWPGAANLGSWIVTESVDAMRARIMATVFTDPIWIVEGFGADAAKAPIVEEFHQWKADETKLPQALGRAIHNSLIEGTGVLEVADRITLRKSLRKIRALIQQDATTGLTTVGDDGHPVFVRDQKGNYVEAEHPEDPHAVMVVSEIHRATAGPSYRVVGLKDFYILPGHASERSDVWGYAKRLWLRLAELKCRERDGYYKNIDQLGGPASSERMTPTGGVSDVPGLAKAGQDIAPQQHEATAEKEIWELTLLLDLDDDGYDEWYIVTYSHTHRQILRVQHENYDTPSYVILTPFPRTDSIYGFSYAKDKLGSLYDEHTALRNMFTDRMALKNSAPIIQVEGSPWNPAERPFGPSEVIPVRDINEIKQLEVSDVSNSVVAAMKEVVSAKERLSGMNDTTTGQLADANRTLGEVKLVTQQSWIRIDEVVKNLQQGIEDLFHIVNIIWKNKLQDDPEPWPGDILASMEARAINLGDQITADVLEGTFRGKPRGSVEASDFSQMRADMVQMITAITQLGQGVPALQAQLNNPQTIRSILTQLARVYRWPDRANLVGNFTGMPPMPSQPPPGGPGGPGGPAGAPPSMHRPQGRSAPPSGVPGMSNQPNATAA